MSRNNDIWLRKPAGMVLGLDFSGGRVTTPDGQAGTLVGNAAVAAGTRYLALDGVGDYLSIPRTAVTNNLSASSYCFWIYPLTMPVTTSLKRVYTKASTNSNGPTIWIGDISGTFNNALEFNVQGAATASSWYADNCISAATWTACALTWDGTNAAGAIKIYINGVSNAVVQRNATWASHDDSGNDILLGIRSVLLDNGLDGWLADFRLYNRELTQPEIAQIYNAGVARIAQGGTP